MTYEDTLRRWPQLQPVMVGLPPDLRSCFSVRELPAGYIIHQKDSPLERVGILCEGALRVVNEFATGNAYMIEHTRPLDFIGDVTVLAGALLVSVTIETTAPSTVLFFPRDEFERWMEQDAALVRELGRRVATKLYQSSYHRGKELFYSSPRLLMEYLLRCTEGADEVCRLPDTRQRLCEELGMSLKTVDRTILKCKEQGLLDTSRGKICVTPAQREEISRRLAQWLE